MFKMGSMYIADLYRDLVHEEVDVQAVKLHPDFSKGLVQLKENTSTNKHSKQDSEENRSSNALSAGQSSISIVLDQGHTPPDDTSVSSTSPMSPPPICRQFWKAGSYNDGNVSKVQLQNGRNNLRIHPKFLHSNATSHKWAFGAIAELLDNAFDEIQKGATFVIADKILNPKDGSPALLFQDDGHGMDPEAIRHCMSFGFSDKNSVLLIGQYGNGFKTSTMRLGADVIVFSRHQRNRSWTQSVGLLSYTFLTQTGLDRIVVPMVDYEFNASTGTLTPSYPFGREHFISNLSVLCQWSPYSTESEILKELEKIGAHGTRIVIYNLWFNAEGILELDFDSDPEDIRIGGERKTIDAGCYERVISEQHIAHRIHFSLRAYISILYKQVPDSFRIILRGRAVEFLNIARDLKFPEFIVYKPQAGGCLEGSVITTIGFLKEAPQVNVDGFNVYHKNRLILPFWRVKRNPHDRGRGVVGVLEANFIEPTHSKQDFEKTSLFQKLEVRLKDMMLEYWDTHCHLIGYEAKKVPKAPVPVQMSSSKSILTFDKRQPVTLGHRPPAIYVMPEKPGERVKRTKRHNSTEPVNGEMQAGRSTTPARDSEAQVCFSLSAQPGNTINQFKDQKASTLMQEKKKLHARCLDYEKRQKELQLKVLMLQRELLGVNEVYRRLSAEAKMLGLVKMEREKL